MQIVGILVALILIVSATDAKEADERAVIKGLHCDYVMYLSSIVIQLQ